jgi:ABC-type phosphate transport system substrate-binding protein
LGAALLGALLSLAGPARPAAAAVYVPISGSGSTLSANAFQAWIVNVTQYGLHVNYARVGSATGRSMYSNGTVDWAATDLPYGVDDPPPPRGFAYMPDHAVATTFAYSLKIGTRRVTNLRLSGATIAKIFTGVLTSWDDPAIAADNPGLTLPAIRIVPVVRTDASGSTFQFTQWMTATEGQYWTAFCAKVGRNPCTSTSTYPVLDGSGIIGQSGDLGVAGYVGQAGAVGAIGVVDYPYAVQSGIPVAKVLNAAGYYTEPTAGHVGVSLLRAKINMDQGNRAGYLTEDLSDVYTDPDPRTYELSWYSYMVLPTSTEFGITTDKGYTLGAFGTYLLCQGQNQIDQLGYAALPANLVEAGFAQLQNVPGAQVPQPTTAYLQSCGNPTLTTADPQPQPCDRIGATQCLAGPVAAETINVNVPDSEGVFTVTVSSTPVQLSTAALTADNTAFETTGQLGTVTINDDRNQSQPGWRVSGQIGDFTGNGQTFSGSDLGWTPAVITGNPAHDVVAAAAVSPGTVPGLAGGSSLAGAAATKGLGTTVLGATLDLRIPAGTAPGSYSATLTITVLTSGS